MFKNRLDAGKKLAQALVQYKKSDDCVVVGLTRGGVVVANEVAKALELPLEAISVRKVGMPGNPELAIGGQWG